MLKHFTTIILALLFVTFAFGNGGPVQHAEDVSTGYINPNLHPWSTDDVTWAAAAPLPQYQYRSANGVVGDYFYVFGEQNNPYANAFNLTSEAWEASTSPPLGNCNWCGVPTDDALYIVGRYSGSYGDEVQKFVPDGAGPTGTWTQVASYPMAMCGIAAAWDGGDYIYAAGGGGSAGAVANAYKYSISGDTWTAIADMPAAQKYHGAWFADGKFVSYGGYVTQNACHVYDPGTDTWSLGADVPEAVYFCTFSTTGTTDFLYSIGGGAGYGSWPATDAVQIYDPDTDTWTAETSLPAAHGLNAAGYYGDGNVVSAGGYPTTYDCFLGEGFAGGVVPPPTWEEIDYNWVEISVIGTNTGITNDDHNVGPFDMGFAFPWYDGATHNSIRVCSNGFATFTSTSTDFSNNPIPDTPEPNNVVAPYWDDMNPTQGGAVYYHYDEPNGRFIIQWDGVPHYSTGGSYTFEAILYDDGTIEYMFQELTPGTANSATVGVENDGGTEGIQLTFDGSGPFNPAPLSGVRIFPVGVIPAYDITVTMAAVAPPIQIPANGGTFDFNATIENNEPGTNSYDLWTTATLPTGSETGALLLANVTNAQGFSTTRLRTQNVPASAPTGTYTYHLYAGMYPDISFSTDSFEFEKLAVADGGSLVNDWNNWGESFDELVGNASTPDEYALNNAYPNPFNPSATITYTLAEAAEVKLTVFDISGREVAVLVDGWVNGGLHQAIFNAENLASGVYFYTIKAGSFTDTKKMILMK